MNDEDLRDLFAGFAMVGLMKLHINDEALAAAFCYRMADAMLDAKYAENVPEVGIAAVKKRTKKPD